jgi:hypothetical protein
MTFSLTRLSILKEHCCAECRLCSVPFMLSVIYAVSQKAYCAECHYAECPNAKRRGAK